MDGSFDNLFFSQKNVEKLYPCSSRIVGNDVKVPHWAKTLIYLFKGLTVEVKTTNSKSIRQMDQCEFTCRVHDELLKKVARKKEQFTQRIDTLKGIINENNKYRKLNSHLICHMRDIGAESLNQFLTNSKQLTQFELNCRVYEKLCEKVMKEKTVLEQKCELLEEVVDELEKYKQCNCISSKIDEMRIEEEKEDVVSLQKNIKHKNYM